MQIERSLIRFHLQTSAYVLLGPIYKLVQLFGIYFNLLKFEYMDYTKNDFRVVKLVPPYTLTSSERIY